MHVHPPNLNLPLPAAQSDAGSGEPPLPLQQMNALRGFTRTLMLFAAAPFQRWINRGKGQRYCQKDDVAGGGSEDSREKKKMPPSCRCLPYRSLAGTLHPLLHRPNPTLERSFQV